MDARLLEILVCPVCKGPLDHRKAQQELVCKACKLAYPIRDEDGHPWLIQGIIFDITCGGQWPSNGDIQGNSSR